MADAALKLRFSEQDDSCPPSEEEVMPVPAWSYRLHVGPALLLFYQYCLAQCARSGKQSFQTTVPKLMEDFGGVDDRTVKSWIGHLLAPRDDDQDHAWKAYQRKGLLACDKTELRGRFTLTPIRPADLTDPERGPRPTPRRASPQRRLIDDSGDGEPQGFAQDSADMQTPAVPQEFAQDPAAELFRLMGWLRARQGTDWWDDWINCGTQAEIRDGRIVFVAPHRVVAQQLDKLYRSFAGLGCRAGFPRGETVEIRFADSEGHSAKGRDRPQGLAQDPAVLFNVITLRSFVSPTEKQKNNVNVNVCAAQILERAAAIEARFAAPENFYRWQWVQAAWAVETGRLSEETLEDCLAYCHSRSKPHWQYTTAMPRRFKEAGISWLDPRRPEQRVELLDRLAKHGVEWQDAWEGPPRKPR